jgi:hypothetical protein
VNEEEEEKHLKKEQYLLQRINWDITMLMRK